MRFRSGAIGRRALKAAGTISLCLLSTTAFAAQQPAAAATNGKAIFAANCAFCHGADATGGRGPDLVRSTLVAKDVKGNLIGPVIRNGRPEKGMPAFHLSDEEIADIAAFLHSRIDQAINSARLPKDYSAKWLLTGNAAAGETYFNGAGGCKNCHSTSGDLAHVASRLSAIELQRSMLYPRKDDPTATVTLTSGQQITGQLLYIDEFSVAIDQNGWHRSYPRNSVKVEIHDPLAAHRKLLDEITPKQMHDLFAFLETLK